MSSVSWSFNNSTGIDFGIFESTSLTVQARRYPTIGFDTTVVTFGVNHRIRQ